MPEGVQPPRPRSSVAASNRPARPGAAGAEQDVHLLDRLAIIYRYRRIAAAVFVLTSAALMIQGYSNVRMFQAQARLLIEDERSTAMPGITNNGNAYYEDPLPYYTTQYRILKGRDLTRRVVRKVNLAAVPEFNGTAVPPPTPFQFIQDLSDSLKSLIVKPPAQQAQQEAPKVDETADESGLVSAFIGRVSVVPVPDSRLVDVLFTSTEPEFAAKAVNTLVDEYVDQNLEVKLQSTQNMLGWLENELNSQRQKVQESDRQLADYRAREDAMSLDDKNNIVQSRLNSLNDALVRARTNRIEKESLYNQVKTQSATATPDAIPAVSQNPLVQSIKSNMAELQRQKAQLLDRYLEKHPEVQKVNAALSEQQRQLEVEAAKALQSIRNDYERAVLEEKTLSSSLNEAKTDVQDQSRRSVNYNVMEREAQSYRTVYETLLQSEKELRVSSNSRSNNVRVIDHAEIPSAPMSPSGRRAWMMAILIGLAAALGVAYAARIVGAKASVLVMDTAPDTKIHALERLGALVEEE